ncbi:MAG: hypothetical protein EOO43_00410 [Flavobacterium sp.]|nr:MAG: hypothetical protein EOO43_00410 [Flavobacterium sp.]
MVKLGYVKALEVPGGLPDFILTQLGLDTLQNQTFQSLSATSFFNYQTHLTNKEMHSMNEKMHILSKRSFIANVIAIVISIISIIVAIVAVVA